MHQLLPGPGPQSCLPIANHRNIAYHKPFDYVLSYNPPAKLPKRCSVDMSADTLGIKTGTKERSTNDANIYIMPLNMIIIQ
jgi:hypothetical protein